MKAYLSEDVKVSLIQAPQDDGQGDPTSTSVDMAGWDGCLFVGIVGVITTTGTVLLAVQQSADNVNFNALVGATAQADLAADSDKMLMIDVQNPTDRYLNTLLTRAAANSIYGGTIAIQYRGKNLPCTQPAAMLAAALVKLFAPAES